MHLFYLEIKKNIVAVTLFLSISLILSLCTLGLSSISAVSPTGVFETFIVSQYRVSQLFWILIFVSPLSFIVVYWHTTFIHSSLMEVYRYKSYKKWLANKVVFIFFLNIFSFCILFSFPIMLEGDFSRDFISSYILLVIYSLILSLLFLILTFYIRSFSILYLTLMLFHVINVIFYIPQSTYTFIYFTMLDEVNFYFGTSILLLVFFILLIVAFNLEQNKLFIKKGDRS